METNVRTTVLSLILALCSGGLVAALWSAGLFAPLQAAFLVGETASVAAPAWAVVMLIAAASAGGGFAVERMGGRRAFALVCASLLVLCALSFLLSATLALDIAFAPCALASLAGATAAQLRRLWSLDARLTHAVEHRVFACDQRFSKSDNERVDAGLQILGLMFKLEEAVIFGLDRAGVLHPMARKRTTNGNGADAAPLQTWRQGVALCERALAACAMQLAGDAGRRVVALPLVHEGQKAGALLLRLGEELEEEDKPLLDVFAAQIARSFQRARAREPLAGRPLPALVSARRASKRLEGFAAVAGMLDEQGFAAAALIELKDGCAVAYLDGTIAAINRPMLESAGLTEEEAPQIDLFALLDRFRAGVFDEPSIAVRRVLQSGEAYEREIYYPEKDRTLLLRLSLLRSGGAAIGLLFSVRDVTRLKEYEKLRSDMISLMSHELRTPITSINGFAELLALDESLSAEAREYATIVHQESQRLSRMIDTFLSMTRLEASDRQEVRKVPLRLDEVVRETVANFQRTARKKRIRLIERTNGKLPPVAADRGLIMQAVANLVDNAIRYSPERTTVTVATALEADAVRVIVEDQGYGIPAEEQDRVWEKFYRVARDGQEKDEESTGLGLAFVREVVEQHGGQVALESEPGRGSIFSFTLPRL
ncbi:MAG: hypothetical protein C4334_01065 [Pyrinomonas sp.]|uniref:sensor histidine kinase n=1 Tax=Pyrinomonas sp. TaxID=2080306 RepID=UPI00331C6331